jgi:signal transduction histidine kinase
MQVVLNDIQQRWSTAAGQLAGGVAYELNNPLTAVLGFAELIAETSGEPRVRDDAQTIVTEALRMREIIQNLVNFWKPAEPAHQLVDVGLLLRAIAAECEVKLARRGVELIVAAPDRVPPVVGNAEQLRVVLEHLLNNAAQSLERRKATLPPAEVNRSGGLPGGDGDAPQIRLTLSESGHGAAHMVHIAVSDTGTGFREPSRVFDPVSMTRKLSEGSGLGLGICYGIVREHGGEISAFNLDPHGAAVVVELPVGEAFADEASPEVLQSAM